MKSLNEAATMMKGSMESMMQGRRTGRNDVAYAAITENERHADELK